MTIRSGCEWSPATNGPAFGNDTHYIEHDATVVVGASGQWHLCAGCAALPKFRQFKKTPIEK